MRFRAHEAYTLSVVPRVMARQTLRPMTLLKFFARAARARIVTPDIARGIAGGCLGVMVMIVVEVVIAIGAMHMVVFMAMFVRHKNILD